MPVYLLHGFRWSREAIRIHVILQNLDDAAAEWIVAPATTRCLRENFQQLYSAAMQHLPNLRFVEQYDPNDTTTSVQPYAYVADFVEEIKLGIDVDEVRGRGINNEQWAAIMELRDKLAQDQKVGWYIVVCGDEERWAPSPSAATSVDSTSPNELGTVSENESTSNANLVDEETPKQHPADVVEPKGLKKFFNATRLGRRKSRSHLENDTPLESKSLPQPAIESKPPQIPATYVPTFQQLDLVAKAPSSMTDSVHTPSDPSDPPDDMVELSASPPTREGLESTAATSVAESGRTSPPKPPSIAPSTRSRTVSISPLRRDGVAPSAGEPGSRGVSPSDTFRGLSELDRRRNASTQSFSSLADAQQKRSSRRFSLQSLQGKNIPHTIAHRSDSEAVKRASRRLSLQTFQSKALSPPKSAPTSASPDSQPEEVDEVEEIISMSPATRAPTQTFRRSRGSRNSLLMSANSSQVYLSSPLSALSENSDLDVYKPTRGNGEMNEVRKPYFGQTVNQFDLIANNIENAFVAMR